MKDDPEFNIRFVRVIKGNPSLYDYNSSDYSNKVVQDKAWEKIAEQISEPVRDCKERWKNLRGSFTRHLKHLSASGVKRKKPYYLADHLSFLLPFTKTRNPKHYEARNIDPLTNEAVVEEDGPDNTSENEMECSDFETDIHPKSPSQIACDDNFAHTGKKFKQNVTCPAPTGEIIRSFDKHFMSKYSTIDTTGLPSIKNNSSDPDFCFLKSMLPDLRAMNSDQKRRFKIGILTMAEEILSESSHAIPSNSSPVRSCHSHSAEQCDTKDTASAFSSNQKSSSLLQSSDCSTGTEEKNTLPNSI